MMHCIIGSNIMDRLVKCPGSLKPGKGSLESYHKSGNKYASTYIENRESVKRGIAIDGLAKDIILAKAGRAERYNSKYTNMNLLDSSYTEPAAEWAKHMLKIKQKFGWGSIDPCYNVSKYIENLPNCEFEVSFNPDFVALPYDGAGIAFVGDLSTGTNNSRNKMFQVICCAVAVIEKHQNITRCVCEVFNPITRKVQIARLNRDELEAYRDDIIIPTLQEVRNALSCESVEDYRHYCSWCDQFCIFRSEGCKSCSDRTAEAENDIEIDIEFCLDNIPADICKYYC